MAPTHKKSGSSPATNKSSRILGYFGFGSKIIRKDAANPEEKWGCNTLKVVQLSAAAAADHQHQALPVAKLLLINQTALIDHQSQEKKKGIGNFIKQFGYGAKERCDAEIHKKSSIDRSKSTQMNESNDSAKLQVKQGENSDSKMICRKPKRASRSKRRNLEGDAMAAMSILMVVLTILLICGRLCAILCASIWFYCMPRLIKTTPNNNNNNNNNNKPNHNQKLISAKHESSEFDSDAYRKKVILQGLLGRKNSVYMGFS